MASPEGQQGGEEGIPPNATVYVRNINERVKIPIVIESLRGIFSTFGEIQDIIAKSSLKRKGQAFVVFDDIESAQNAIDDLNGFELFGQQLSLDFAKTRSDVTVRNEDGEEAYEAHKAARLDVKKRKQAHEEAIAAKAKSNKRVADDSEATDRPVKIVKQAVANKDVPDEYLPPNKTLLLRDLPADFDRMSIVSAFNNFPGYSEVRPVPGRPLAFVEFEDADSATVAKDATAGLQIGGNTIRVTFRRN